jgi:hypothetical protein
MLSDIVWSGYFQYRTTTRGGTTAHPARTIQLDVETLAITPAPTTATIQSAEAVTFTYVRFIERLYDVLVRRRCLEVHTEARGLSVEQRRASR